MRSSLAALAGVALLLGGCKQGPDFFSPAAPGEKAYTTPDEPVPPPAVPGVKSHATQRVAIVAKVQDDWWTLFHSPQLEAVVKDALRDSPTIAQATATLAQGRELVTAATGAMLPQVDLSAQVGRQAVNVAINGTNRAPEPVNVFGVGPTVSYTFDVFGALQRNIEAQSALADVNDYQLAAAYLSLTGNITGQAITIAGLRAQIKTVNDILADDQRNLDLVKTQQAGGTATMVDVTTAQTQLANDRALLPPLRQQLSVARDALVVYAGKTPADWSPPDFDLRDLTLPPVVPLSLPSELVRQRPDILAAEAQLHVAAAQLGIATADLYPKFTLTAGIAQEATMIGRFFTAAYNGWSVLGGMAAPIFHGGTLTAQQRAAKDALDATWAGYRQVVIQAFGQVADQLQALAHDDEAVKTQLAAVASADQALKLARLSYEGGNSTLLQLLDPQRAREQAVLGLVRAKTQQLADTAQLMIALGSGWWNTPPAIPGPEPDPHALLPGSPTAAPALPKTEAPDDGPFWVRWFKS
ncbi:MAG TPA: efflux transporter outer membrane subunit [Stellaceae bacterium]|jgi:NodT family efflux transporter outer membrane factor (OMF) lipoprotein|nr:efflux transporter outer membrane subunit [Stellaceae bacterium]